MLLLNAATPSDLSPEIMSGHQDWTFCSLHLEPVLCDLVVSDDLHTRDVMNVPDFINKTRWFIPMSTKWLAMITLSLEQR